MTAIVQAGRRHLPRGWADLGLQVGIWFGFLGLYQVARGVADRNPTQAFENGLGVIRIEERVGDLFELTAANFVSGSHFLLLLVNWTYWNSEFTVVGLALLWVYLRRNEAFLRFRNWILLANLVGLIGYVVVPTAPPAGVISVRNTSRAPTRTERSDRSVATTVVIVLTTFLE